MRYRFPVYRPQSDNTKLLFTNIKELIELLFWFTIEPFEQDSDLFTQLMNGYHNNIMVQNEPFELSFYLVFKLLSG